MTRLPVSGFTTAFGGTAEISCAGLFGGGNPKTKMGRTLKQGEGRGVYRSRSLRRGQAVAISLRRRHDVPNLLSQGDERIRD
jgi:hypothetical protein